MLDRLILERREHFEQPAVSPTANLCLLGGDLSHLAI